MPELKPIFCVVLRDGAVWQIEAEWPDGSIETVGGFEDYNDAVRWLDAEAENWLKRRV